MARIALLILILLSCFSFIFAQDTTDDPPWDVAPWPLENHRPQPEYPVIMRQAGTGGQIEILVSIDSLGVITKVELLKEHPRNLGMVTCVESALKGWLFDPAKRNGIPIQSEVPLEFRFIRLDRLSDQEEPVDSLEYWIVPPKVEKLLNQSYIQERNDKRELYQPAPILYVRNKMYLKHPMRD